MSQIPDVQHLIEESIVIPVHPGAAFVTGLHGHEKPISFNTPLHSELYDAVMRLPSKYRIGIDFSETVTADQDGTIIS